MPKWCHPVVFKTIKRQLLKWAKIITKYMISFTITYANLFELVWSCINSSDAELWRILRRISRAAQRKHQTTHSMRKSREKSKHKTARRARHTTHNPNPLPNTPKVFPRIEVLPFRNGRFWNRECMGMQKDGNKRIFLKQNDAHLAEWGFKANFELKH